MQKFTSRPITIQAFQWQGGNTGVLEQYLGQNWGRADAKGVPWAHKDQEQIVIYNTLERAWIPVPVGHWVICGTRGEFYPCDPGVFEAKYSPATVASDNNQGGPIGYQESQEDKQG